jgi:SAM-dependent methyltransferase
MLKRNRERLESELAGKNLRRFYSPVLYSLDAALRPAIREHAVGRVLDAWCGQRPYRGLLESFSDRYESLDVTRRFPDQTYVSDIQAMPTVTSSRYDTVICSEVLEHLPRPLDALREICRVLRPGGKAIITVPYLGRLHEEPHDFFRYTIHGLRYLIEEAGLSIVRIDVIGSTFSFIGHQASTLLVAGSWHIPGIRWIAFGLNAVFITLPSYWIDRAIGSSKLPLGYIAVAQRPDRQADL